MAWSVLRQGVDPPPASRPRDVPGTTEPGPIASDATAAPSHAEPSAPSTVGAITAEEAIDNVDCRMEAGRGAAGNFAVVLLPSETGVRFSVIGGEGEVFSGVLPFAPDRLELGKSPDGGLVVGAGRLFRGRGGGFRGRWGSHRLRRYGGLWASGADIWEAEGSAYPVRIYVDGQIVHETAKAWQFGVARDGSSFFIHEPLGTDASRLIVRDLLRNEEEHHFLGPLCSNKWDRGGCRASYTHAGGEVVLSPSGSIPK